MRSGGAGARVPSRGGRQTWVSGVRCGSRQIEVPLEGRPRRRGPVIEPRDEHPHATAGTSRRTRRRPGAPAAADGWRSLSERQGQGDHGDRPADGRSVRTARGRRAPHARCQRRHAADCRLRPPLRGDHRPRSGCPIRGLGADPTAVRVGDIATSDVVWAHPGWTVEKAMRVMAANQLGRLPVVDDRQQLVGVVTLTSLVLRSGKAAHTMDAARRVAQRSAKTA
jgi:hypothetical protein